MKNSIHNTMALLEAHKEKLGDGPYLKLCDQLKATFDLYEKEAPPPAEEDDEEDEEAVFLVLQVTTDDTTTKFDLGRFPATTNRGFFVPTWDKKPATPAGFGLPLKHEARAAYCLLERTERTESSAATDFLKSCMNREIERHIDYPLRRYLSTRARKKINDFEIGTVASVHATEHGRDGSVFLLEVLDSERMCFHIQGLGPYTVLLTMMPRPALVVLHNKAEEMNIEDPSWLHANLAVGLLISLPGDCDTPE